MKEKILKINRTLFDLELGILIYGGVCQLLLLFFKNRGTNSIGLWIGILLAALSGVHMWYSLERGLSIAEGDSGKFIAGRSTMRYVCIVFGLGAVALTGIGNVLTAFLGVMGLKVAAYVQPFTRKISNLFLGEEGR